MWHGTWRTQGLLEEADTSVFARAVDQSFY